MIPISPPHHQHQHHHCTHSRAVPHTAGSASRWFIPTRPSPPWAWRPACRLAPWATGWCSRIIVECFLQQRLCLVSVSPSCAATYCIRGFVASRFIVCGEVHLGELREMAEPTHHHAHTRPCFLPLTSRASQSHTTTCTLTCVHTLTPLLICSTVWLCGRRVHLHEQAAQMCAGRCAPCACICVSHGLNCPQFLMH